MPARFVAGKMAAVTPVCWKKGLSERQYIPLDQEEEHLLVEEEESIP